MVVTEHTATSCRLWCVFLIGCLSILVVVNIFVSDAELNDGGGGPQSSRGVMAFQPATADQATHSTDTIISESGTLPRETFLNVVKPHPELPECKSGNEFLSLGGGYWHREPTMVKNKTMFMNSASENRPSCYWDAYKDEHVWSANCSLPVLNTEMDQIRVILLGDSLSRQVVAASKELNLKPFNLTLFVLHIPMLKTVPFKSSVCESCVGAISKNAKHFRLTFLDETEFLDPFLEYDFLFYNEFAHFAGFFQRRIMEYFIKTVGRGENISTRQLTDDILDWFERQMQRKAELLQTIKTKVYYRTVPPHATSGVVIKEGEARIGRPLKQPAREVPREECYNYKSGWGALCYSVMNEIATRAFLSHGHSVLDAAPMMSQRVDARPCWSSNFKDGDCLHFCQPGPPSVVVAAIVAEVLAQIKDV